MSPAFPLIFLLFFVFLILPLIVFSIIANWKIYEKAGKPGWAVLIPVYNTIVLLEIVRKPIWWIALMFIPIANLVVIILIYIELAKVFGKDSGFALGLVFLSPIFIMILGFGDAKYIAPASQEPAGFDSDPESNLVSVNDEGVLPNATAVLVLGIVSIVGCAFYGVVGLVCGIIALSLHKRNKDAYALSPTKYVASWKNAKAGYICAIIGVSLSALYFIAFLMTFVFLVIESV
ncbi:MAG: CCC motif membrane protein [Crocinitomicaceae bacterium]|nr:CCC motif membrane protein [Crocinitomicaceae bacterium]MDG1777276.1 CCC motif membrane protein [Crocinitomicaceae bacterium]